MKRIIGGALLGALGTLTPGCDDGDHAHGGDGHDHAGDNHEPAPAPPPAAPVAAEAGPHGGSMAPLGGEKAELIVDDKGVHLYVLGADGQPVQAEGEARVVLQPSAGAEQRVVLQPMGNHWMATGVEGAGDKGIATVSLERAGASLAAKLPYGGEPAAAHGRGDHGHGDHGH